MFDHLAIDVDYDANWRTGSKSLHRLYVPGSTLLAWAQSAANSVTAGAKDPAGRGTESDPYKLGGFGSYAGAWKVANKARGEHVYFSIAGRKIKKIARRNSKPDGFADGCYMCDTGFSGTDATSGAIWSRHDGASYREFGKFIHEGESISGMEGVVWSQHVASSLRTIIKGKAAMKGGQLKAHAAHWEVDMNKDEAARKAPKKVSGPSAITKADTMSALPLLSAVMFIAEPMRNARAWLMGLMLLDLMGAEYSPEVSTSTSTTAAKHFTFQRAFVHPSRLNDPKWAHETNTQNDKAPVDWVAKQAKDAREASQMAKQGSPAVEGLYPPSPKWSGRTKDKVDVANDYIQQKEVALLCRWLEQEGNAYLRSSGVIRLYALAGGAGTRRNALTADFGGNRKMQGFGAELEDLLKTKLIARRASSFNSPGTLFK